MLKNIVVVFLLIFIIIISSFSFFYISFHYNISALNSVNSNSRWTFRENRFLRNIFRLTERGDARSDYSKPSPFSKLKFEVYSGSAGSLYPGSIDLIKNELKEVINKPGGITIVEKNLDNIPLEAVDQFLNDLAKNLPEYAADTAVMRIYVLSSYKTAPDILGQTIGAYGFALFKKSIDKNDAGGSVAKDLEKEAILHEIGHLLGAEHSTNLDCVMNQYVDSTDTFTLTFTPTKYCSSDVAAIQEANY